MASAIGVEFEDAQKLLRNRTALPEVVTGWGGDLAMFEVLPVQLFCGKHGDCVEPRVLAADGEDELVACIYARTRRSQGAERVD
ncbi:MAG: hypothetical protein K0U93_29890 [Gammaproteobacteria bacterium]|nr:hypothetical protein [Gammaproteobacteria bacterium]